MKKKMSPLIALVALFVTLVTIPALAAQNDVRVESRESNRVITDRQTPANDSNTRVTDISVREAADRVSENGIEDWMLTLVNAENPLPDDYTPKLKSLGNKLSFDERAVKQLKAMLSAAKAEGLSPVVCSAYRTLEYQRTLFNNQIRKQAAKGLTHEQADIEARKVVAYPGTSEHNLGLAADIVSTDYQHLDEKQANTAEVKWLLEHCGEYGFILRYPKGKEDITGVTYEPWHFRYVGTEAAKKIMDNGLCLEEYLSIYSGGNR